MSETQPLPESHISSLTEAETLITMGYLKQQWLHYMVGCRSAEELISCLRIIGAYNMFDAEEVVKNITPLLGRTRYYPKETDKVLNGRIELLDYTVGRAYSPIVQVSLADAYTSQYEKDHQVHDYSVEQFEAEMRELARASYAQECSMYESKEDEVIVARLWWD